MKKRVILAIVIVLMYVGSFAFLNWVDNNIKEFEKEFDEKFSQTVAAQMNYETGNSNE